MSTTIGKLSFIVSADSSGVLTGLNVGESAFRGFSSRVTSIYQSLRAQFQLNPITQFLGWGVKLAAEAQQAETGFRVFLGSGEDAKQLMQEIRDFALVTPLTSPQLQQAASMLLGYGVAGEQVMPTLRMLGDISRGSAQRLDLLALAIGQVVSKGRLMGNELKQLTEQGFNPLQIISEKTGISIGDLMKRMEEGGISSQNVLEALKAATSEGGRFFGLLSEQSQTLAGRWQNLQESAGILARRIGEALTPTLMELISVGKSTLDWLGNLNFSTVRSVANISAMVIGFTAAVNIFPRIVSGIATVVTAYRQMATAQTILLALSGPQGIAQLTVGLVAAGLAGYAVNRLFDSMDDSAGQATAQVESATKALKDFDAQNKKPEGLGKELRENLEEQVALEKELKSLRAEMDKGDPLAARKWSQTDLALRQLKDNATELRRAMSDVNFTMQETADNGAEALKTRLQELKDEAFETKRRFDDLIRQAEQQRNRNVGSVERFTQAAFAAEFGSQNGSVEKEIRDLKETLRLELRRIQDEERAVQKAIREEGKVEVTEVRI